MLLASEQNIIKKSASNIIKLHRELLLTTTDQALLKLAREYCAQVSKTVHESNDRQKAAGICKRIARRAKELTVSTPGAMFAQALQLLTSAGKKFTVSVHFDA